MNIKYTQIDQTHQLKKPVKKYQISIKIIISYVLSFGYL
jgi:hypothetical protein